MAILAFGFPSEWALSRCILYSRAGLDEAERVSEDGEQEEGEIE